VKTSKKVLSSLSPRTAGYFKSDRFGLLTAIVIYLMHIWYYLIYSYQSMPHYLSKRGRGQPLVTLGQLSRDNPISWHLFVLGGFRLSVLFLQRIS